MVQYEPSNDKDKERLKTMTKKIYNVTRLALAHKSLTDYKNADEHVESIEGRSFFFRDKAEDAVVEMMKNNLRGVLSEDVVEHLVLAHKSGRTDQKHREIATLVFPFDGGDRGIVEFYGEYSAYDFYYRIEEGCIEE